MIQGGRLLGIPTAVTEQYPKGLGKTASELDLSGLRVFEKTRFSMSEAVFEFLLTSQCRSVVLFGIEVQ